MMMKIIYFILLIVSSLPLLGKESPETKATRSARGNPQLAAELALKHKDSSVAICCYGMFLETSESLGTELAANTVAKFSKKRGLFNIAAALASFYDVEALISNIIKEKNGELAAAILACKAYAGSLNSPDGGDFPQGSAKNGKKGPKAKKAKAINAAFTIPVELFASKNVNTQYLAILAAAYAKKDEHKEVIAKLKAKSPQVASAKILYQVVIGDVPDVKQINEAFKKATKVKKPIKGESPILSDIDMNIPAMCPLVDALGRLKDSKYLPLVHRALDSKDIRVQIDAVRAMRRIGDKSSLKYLQDLLPRCPWNLLIDICLALGENPDTSSIQPLINRFKKETGRFRLDVNYALCSIAGRKAATTAAEWVKWWSLNKAAFKVDEGATDKYRSSTRLQDCGVPALGGFYNIGIYSDRCCFVLDSSNSMEGDKIESLKENSRDTIGSMAKHVMYNIVDFGGDINVLDDRSLINKPSKGLDYIYELDLSVGTRSIDAMTKGIEIPELDTIYFLSDGAPWNGRMENWESISALLLMMARYRHIAISTICFKAGRGNDVKMKNVADENYGHTENIE